MPETTRRRRRPSITGEQLLEKAFELFVELGFEGTSIDAITAAAGIAKRTIYSRYGDKESLFKAAMHHEIERWAKALDGLHDAETHDLEQSLVQIGQILLDSVLSPQGMRLLQLTGSVARRMPEIGARNVQEGTAPILSFLEDLFRRRLGERLLCFPDPADAAVAFMNLVVGGPANIAAQGQQLDGAFMDRYVKSSVCLFLRGVQTSADTQTFAALEDENLRLKKLLAEAMIDLDIARQGARQPYRPGTALRDRES
jgi:TetR/AcrR family transcriptional repressor of mexJK operon